MKRRKGEAPSQTKRNKPSAPSEEVTDIVRKPGLETSCPHIAEMFIEKHQHDLARELTRQLRAPLARRLGIYRG